MKRRLSALDAFFVAYQEIADVDMHLGAEFELRGPLSASQIEAAIEAVLRRWPSLSCQVHLALAGLVWDRPVPAARLLHRSNDRGALRLWRNVRIDPFREPALQLLWFEGAETHVLALRAHHWSLDGEGFVLVCLHFFDVLAALVGGAAADALPDADVHRPRTAGTAAGRSRWPRLVELWRHKRWRDRMAQRDLQARLALRAVRPGPIAICEARLHGAALASLRRRCAAVGLGGAWVGMAAWMRALRRWNGERGGDDNPLVSLEVPMSLRAGLADPLESGNHVAPLLLAARADQPRTELARALKATFKSQVERGLHLAVPLFAAPGRYLPWPLFRRVAITTSSTGFATSHFVWLTPRHGLAARVSELSAGRLTLRDHRAYTPVCLKMGAALTAIAWPDELKLLLTYRENALDAEDATGLLTLLCEELSLS